MSASPLDMEERAGGPRPRPQPARRPEAGIRTWVVSGLIGQVLFFLAWMLIGEVLFSRPAFQQFQDMMPWPALQALAELSIDPAFWQSVAASLRRVLVGICLALVFGIPSGLLIGFYRSLRLVSYPAIQFLRMISPLSWMPIALIIFEGFEAAIYFLITVATVWPVILNTVFGVARVNPGWLKMARNQGASDWQLIRYIIIPASLPYIMTSLRLGLGVAWIVLVPVEFLGVSSGLGYLINDARDTLEYDRLMALVLAIGILGFAMDGLIHLGQRSVRWHAGD